MVYEDNTACQFNLKNYKILYIINSENCFYRRLALRRAAKVTKHSYLHDVSSIHVHKKTACIVFLLYLDDVMHAF